MFDRHIFWCPQKAFANGVTKHSGIAPFANGAAKEVGYSQRLHLTFFLLIVYALLPR